MVACGTASWTSYLLPGPSKLCCCFLHGGTQPYMPYVKSIGLEWKGFLIVFFIIVRFVSDQYTIVMIEMVNVIPI